MCKLLIINALFDCLFCGTRHAEGTVLQFSIENGLRHTKTDFPAGSQPGRCALFYRTGRSWVTRWSSSGSAV
jgi:hypothetical protein